MFQYLLAGWLMLAVLVQSSTYIIDQQFFTDGFTDNDCSLWGPFGATVPMMKFSTCASHRIFGGYNIFVGDPTNPNGFTKSWINLIPHYSVTVTATLYKIDSWIDNTIFFMIDGITAKLYTFNAANGGTSDFCGNPTPIPDIINTSYNDLIVSVSFTVAHTASGLNLRVISNLVGSAGSWGIRNLNITMEACDESCASCSGSSACTSCNVGLVIAGSYCVCSSGIRQKYVPCTASPCATCLATLPCVLGYYLSAITTYCQPCNVACSSCTSPINSGVTCSSCKTAGFILPSPGSACSSCFSGCLTCSSTASNACLTCKYGYFYDSTTHTCLQACPAGKYSEESSASCIPCNTPPCATCVGNSGTYYCLSCSTNWYLYGYTCYTSCPYSLIGYQGLCIASCPSGTYPNSVTLTCMTCVSNCLECTNGTGCFICNSGTFLYNGLCYTTCPVGYGNTLTQLCLSCHSSCLTCNGAFSDNCLSCPGTHLISNVCYTTCPNNTYSITCLPCDTTCLTCSGPTSNNCLTCASPLFYHINLTACLSTCQTGEISNNYNFTCTQCPFGLVAYFEVCQPCSQTCLNCNGITFLECTSCIAGTYLVKSTCVLVSDNKIIFMPYKSNGSGVKNAFLTIFIIQICLCVLLEALFQYKTNLLLTIELLQILSYTQFLTIELSQSTQSLAQLLYLTNFAALLNPITVDPHALIPPKFQVLGKTGIFLADAFGIQLVIIISCILFLAIKYLSHRSQFFKKIYQKINPYLLTYTFRLIALQLALDIMLYIYCFDAMTGLGIGSLVLLLVDFCVIIISLCWRIKTEQDGTQMALFFNNEIGQKSRKQEYLPEEEQIATSVQEKIRKSKILPSVMELLLKLPIPITILYFVGNSSTQSICFFIYFGFYLLLMIIVPIRRRVYRFITLMNASFLVLNALGAVLVARGTSSTYFDGVWLTIMLLLFIFSLFQVISNYRFFIDCLSYLKHQIKHGFKSNQQPNNNESQSNLTSQEEQSVVFERVQREGNMKKEAKSQSKLLQKSHLNNSWIQQKF